MGDFTDQNTSPREVIKQFCLDFFFIGASATKSSEKSRIFRYGRMENRVKFMPHVYLRLQGNIYRALHMTN